MRLFPEGGDDRRLRILVATLSTVAALGMITLLPDYFTPIPFLPASLAALSKKLRAKKGVAASCRRRYLPRSLRSLSSIG